MIDLDVQDSLTKLNTQLNKSMVLMDTTFKIENLQSKSNKSIKINKQIQPAGSSNVSPMSRKSILKRTEKRSMIMSEQTIESTMDTLNETNNTRMSLNVPSSTRPRSINDLMQEDDLILETTESTFNLDDLSDSEDIWIMDIPRTVDPKELKGQTLTLGEKSKFKVNNEKYSAVCHDVKCNVTCILNTSKVKSRFKIVNVKPTGTIAVRRKLSSISKIKPMEIENCSVPFPKNLRTRHPLFGVSYEGKVRKMQ